MTSCTMTRCAGAEPEQHQRFQAAYGHKPQTTVTARIPLASVCLCIFTMLWPSWSLGKCSKVR